MAEEFRPLMDAIRDALEALQPEKMDTAAREKLETLARAYDHYQECCCMNAHVVPYDEKQAS